MLMGSGVRARVQRGPEALEVCLERLWLLPLHTFVSFVCFVVKKRSGVTEQAEGPAMAGSGGAEAEFEQAGPQFAGDQEVAAGGVEGDAVGHGLGIQGRH